MAHVGRWSLWRLLSFNRPYSGLFLIFDLKWPWIGLIRIFLLNLCKDKMKKTLKFGVLSIWPVHRFIWIFKTPGYHHMGAASNAVTVNGSPAIRNFFSRQSFFKNFISIIGVKNRIENNDEKKISDTVCHNIVLTTYGLHKDHPPAGELIQKWNEIT